MNEFELKRKQKEVHKEAVRQIREVKQDSIEVLSGALDVLAVEIESGDGVANTVIAQAAERLRLQDFEISQLSEQLRQLRSF